MADWLPDPLSRSASRLASQWLRMLRPPWLPNGEFAQAEAALILLVPEADPLVDHYRSRFENAVDPEVPAHITINYPFWDGLDLDHEELVRLEKAIGAVPAFGFRLYEVARFAEVVFLTPEPSGPFRQLISLVAQAFPRSPPYDGEFDDIVPHVTIVQLPGNESLMEIETEVRENLASSGPILSHAERVWLMEKRSNGWVKTRSFRLGSA